MKNKEEGRSGTTGTGVSEKGPAEWGETNNKNVISKERRAMQAGSGGHIGRVEKQLGLNLQEGGGRLKPYRDLGLLMSNGLHLKHAWCKV